MLVLGIESTCDETGCALVRDGKEILSNCVASQEDLHEQFGESSPSLLAVAISRFCPPCYKKRSALHLMRWI